MVTTVLVITLYDGLNSKYYNLQFPTKEPKAMSLYRFYFEKGILAPSYLFSRPKLRDLEGIIANATHDLNEVVISAALALGVLPTDRSRCAIYKTDLGLVVRRLMMKI